MYGINFQIGTYITSIRRDVPVTTVAKNGLYFSGKIKELLKELQNLSKEYKTVREVIAKNIH